MQHPAVKAAAVVGLPHVRLGEQVAALVQLKSEDTGTAGERGELNSLARCRETKPELLGHTLNETPCSTDSYWRQ